MPSASATWPRLELWAGPECTVARVRADVVDQLELTGHAARAGDLDRLASLGVAAVRYPVLWERVERDGWDWADERLARLRELGIRPIVGLVHHGSGPPRTSLLDPGFADGLAAFARAAAERYPWVEEWTPVNEPLTTARFSGLYGFWYPHRRDARSLARALLHQCRAVALAIREIRQVIPGARLVQTEDLGKTHATEPLAYQAEHENERRFATVDLLCGRLENDSPFGSWLLGPGGVEPEELAWFRGNPCPPDVYGVNHYLSSERFLDHRLDRYPPELHGSNGRDRYVDELAARARPGLPHGPAVLLREAWERFRIPLAVTEAHNACTREEQLRWLAEIWEAAGTLRAEGADVRAVTVWSAFGAVGWDRLLTGGGRYESGVFDVSGPQPRATALAAMARALARGERYDHPALDAPGWWRRPERLWLADGGPPPARRPPGRSLLLTGRTGTLGRAFSRVCDGRALRYELLGRAELDIADAASAAEVLDQIRPWAVVNAAGYVRVDDAERDAERCRRENADGPAVLAEACARRGIPLVTFSSDLVFDGRAEEPYLERDAVGPLSVYGRTKAEAEARVLAALPEALVVRTSAFFGPWDEWNFVTAALRALARGQEVTAADDAAVSPTYVPELVQRTLDLLIDGESGIWHVANDGAVTWAQLARLAAAAVGLDPAGVRPRPTAELRLAAPRPRWSVLASERGGTLEPLEAALDRYLADRPVAA
jgi:dTDP-4-dehydrorhamnose reductase